MQLVVPVLLLAHPRAQRTDLTWSVLLLQAAGGADEGGLAGRTEGGRRDLFRLRHPSPVPSDTAAAGRRWRWAAAVGHGGGGDAANSAGVSGATAAACGRAGRFR